jgi:hypothetical protein
MDDHIAPAERSQLGLDDPQTILEKLGLFFSVLFLGPILGLLLMVGVVPFTGLGRVLAWIVLETLGMFWLAVLVYIWWRPLWFRRIYLAVERKVIFIVRVTIVGGLLLLFIDGIVPWTWRNWGR